MVATATVLPTSSPDPYYRKGKSREREALRPIEEQHKLILQYRHLPYHWARRLLREGLIGKWFWDEAVSYGNISLVRAARIWDDTRGVKFITYASASIRQRIILYYQDSFRTNSIPFSELEKHSARKHKNGLMSVPDHRAPEKSDEEVRDEIEEALNLYASSVTPYQRNLLRLFYLEGYTQREVASILGKSPWATSRSVEAALKKIRLNYDGKRPTPV